MNESFLETPTPSRQWSEGVIDQAFRCIVNHDGLATRHNVKLDYFWCPDNSASEVRVWLNYPGNSNAVLLYTIERSPDKNMKAELIEGFKQVRKLLMLL
jgi:hypothetical protein